MKPKTSLSILTAVAGLSAFSMAALVGSVATAGPAPKLTLAEAGDQWLDEDFSKSGELGEGWAAAKGKWEIQDGVLKASELAADKHAGVLSYTKPNQNVVVQFDIAFDGAKGFDLSFNYEKGHLWRLSLTPTGATLQKDRDKKDPNSKTEALAKTDLALEPGKSYTVTAEVVGEQIAVKIGDEATLTAAHPSFDTKKPNIRFVVKGESVAIDNVKVWEATPKS